MPKLWDPCPFCGRRDLRALETETAFLIECLTCGSLGPPANNEENATKNWNKRAVLTS